LQETFKKHLKKHLINGINPFFFIKKNVFNGK